MIKVKVYNQEGTMVGSQELSDKVFGVKPKVEVVHQVAVGMLANKRRVLAHAKDRSEVRGGGRKPWRQKGTGRARHGSIRSPLWVGGGVTFGPSKERNFKKKINDKMRRKAIFMCLSDRVADDKMILLDEMGVKEGKTKRMIELVDNLREVFYGSDRAKETDPSAPPRQARGRSGFPLRSKILMLIDKKDEKIQMSCRNIPWLSCVRAQDVNVLDILANEYILTSVAGVKKIEDTFLKH